MKLYLHLEQKEFTVSQQLAPEVTVKQLKEVRKNYLSDFECCLLGTGTTVLNFANQWLMPFQAFVAEYNEKQTAKWQKLNPKYLTAKSEE